MELKNQILETENVRPLSSNHLPISQSRFGNAPQSIHFTTPTNKITNYDLDLQDVINDTTTNTLERNMARIDDIRYIMKENVRSIITWCLRNTYRMETIIENIMAYYIQLDENCLPILKVVIFECIREYYDRRAMRFAIPIIFRNQQPPHRRLSENEFNRLRTFKYDPNIHTNVKDMKCTICASEYEENENIVELLCNNKLNTSGCAFSTSSNKTTL